MTAGEDAFHRFARELANDLALVGRLLATHPPAGPCNGCVLPGPQGAPQAPCPVRVVAVLALQIRTLREVHADEAADERLIDHLGAGGDGADDSDLSALLAALRDEVDR